jgi:hypothetical protein
LERRVLVQLIDDRGRLFVAESSGLRSDWADNLAAAGRATIAYWGGREVSVAATELADGPERDAAIAAQPNNQPAPLRFMYRRARRHIHAVGRVFRLVPLS